MSRLKQPLYTYNLDSINVRNMINASDKQAQEPLKKFIDTIIHINFETFLQQINNMLNIFLNLNNSITKIYIYIDDINVSNYQSKSNYWMYEIIRHLLFENKTEYDHECECAIIMASELKDDKISINDKKTTCIFFADDCLYSGKQMNFTLYQFNNDSINKVLCNKFIFVPYMSKVAYDKLKGYKFNIFFFKENDNSFIEPLKSYIDRGAISKNDIDIILQYYGKINPLNRQVYEYNTFIEKYPIYFDHKIADALSSYPYLFSGVVLNNVNKQHIESIYEHYVKYTTQSSDKRDIKFIPLLKNCENNTEYDVLNSSCPPPPYKDNFEDLAHQYSASYAEQSMYLGKKRMHVNRRSSNDKKKSRPL